MTEYDEFVADDDFLHEPGTHPWRTETWWFSFFVPERRLGAWLYALVRPNQRASGGGAWLWDDTGTEARAARYFLNYGALPTKPERLGASPLRFPSGFEIDVVEPGSTYRLTYADAEAGLEIGLVFTATMDAVGHRASEPPFYESAHFDQVGRVRGVVRLEGEAIPVDCFSVRDRSWGLRSERVAPDFSYCWLATEDEAFLLYASRDRQPYPVTRGFLHRDGLARPIVSGVRRETRAEQHHWVTRIEMEATDDAGRTVQATATALSRLVHPRPKSTNVISLLEWSSQGRHAWGEDQDVWSHMEWRRFLAGTRADG